MGTLGGFPNPPAMGSVGRSPPSPDAMDGNPGRVPKPSRDGVGRAEPALSRRDGWEPWEGSQTLPRWGRSGGARPLPTRWMGTLGGFPNPPAMGSVGRSPPSPDAMDGNPGRVPKPSRDGVGRAEPALSRRDGWEPWEGSQTLPRWGRSGGARPPPTRWMGTLGGFPNPPAMGSVGRSPPSPDAMDGNPGRVPKPSRDGVGRAEPALSRRDGWEPWEGSQTLPRWGRSGGARPPPTRWMGTLGGFPNPPAMGSVGRSPPSPDAMDGNPGRVPKPSRDGVGRAEPALPRRDGWEPWEGSQTLPRWGRSGGARPPPTRWMGTLGGFPNPPAMGSVGR